MIKEHVVTYSKAGFAIFFIVFCLPWSVGVFISSITGAQSVSIFSHPYIYMFEAIKYHDFGLLLISLTYVISIIAILFGAYFFKTFGKYLLILPACFFGTILLGNLLYSWVYSSDLIFSLIYPFKKYYTGEDMSNTAWIYFAFSYMAAIAVIHVPVIFMFLKLYKKDSINFKESFKRYKNGKHGSARFADKKQLMSMNFIHNNRKALTDNYTCYVIGKLKDDSYLGAVELLNTIIVGRRGSGKGTSGSILTLLETKVNCLVNDIKGELFMTTFGERIRIGKKPIAIDVTRELDQYNNFRKHMCLKFNPLWNNFLENISLIRKSQYLNAIVSAFIKDTDDPKEKHWVGKGRSVLRGFITIVIEHNIAQNQKLKDAIKQVSENEFAYFESEDVIYTIDELEDGDLVKGLDGKYKIVENFKLESFDEIKSKKNLIDVKNMFIKAGKDELKGILEDANKDLSSSLIDEAIGTLTQAGKDGELGGILTTMNDATSMLSNPATSHFFESPSEDDIILNIEDFLTGNVDIFYICGVDEAKEYPQILSLFVNLIRNNIKMVSRNDKHDQYLFLFDEIGQLGYLPCIETIDSIGRDLGFIQHLYFQTMDQIDKYKNKNMLKGFEVQRWFKTTEPEAIKYITYLAGKSTINENHKSTSKNSNKDGKQVTKSDKDIGIDLITVDKMRTLPRNEQIVFIHGEVIQCEAVHYFKDKKYNGKFGINYAYKGNKHLCKPYTEPPKKTKEDQSEKNLHFSKTNNLKLIEGLKDLIDNNSDLIECLDDGYYIGEDHIAHWLKESFPNADIDNSIQELISNKNLELKEVDGTYLFKIDCSS